MITIFHLDLIPSIYFWGYLLSAVLTAFIALYSFVYRWDLKSARFFGVVMVLLSWWSITYVGRFLAVTVESKLLWTQLAYVAITILPVAFLCFSLAFSGKQNLVKWKSIGLLLIVPVTTQIALFTNEYHELFYTNVWLYTDGAVPILASRGGEWFYLIHIPYSYTLYLIGTVLLLHFVTSGNYIYKRQVVLLCTGAIVPWIVNLSFLGDFRLHPELDPTPVAISAGMVLIAVAIFRAGFLDVVPVARRTVFDNINKCIFVLDDTNRIIDINEPGRSFLSAVGEEEEAIGRQIDEDFPAQLANVIADESPDTTNVEIKMMIDGAERWYLLNKHRIGVNGFTSQIVTLMDITKHKEKSLRISNQSAQLQHVESAISHDFRNPLTTGRGFLKFLVEDLQELEISREKREELLSYADDVQLTFDRMDEIIEEVLALARSGNTIENMEHIELDAIARHAWKHVDTDDVDLVVSGSRVLKTDSSKLMQVFENIYRNAIVHGECDTVRVGALENGFFIEDDGVGIPEEQRKQIFERGFTNSADGVGLGLTIVQNIVEAHGWQISVDDGENGGARFEITAVESLVPFMSNMHHENRNQFI